MHDEAATARDVLSVAFDGTVDGAYQQWLLALPPLNPSWLSQPLLRASPLSNAAMWECIRATADGVSDSHDAVRAERIPVVRRHVYAQ